MIIEKINLKEDFLDFATRFAEKKGTVVLLSGGSGDCSRYHIMGINPWLMLKGFRENISVSLMNKEYFFKADPLYAIETIIKKFKINPKEIMPNIPLISGLLGYLSYDLKDFIEYIPKTSINDINLPDICFYGHIILIIHDKKKNETFLTASELEGIDSDFFIKDFYETAGKKSNLTSSFLGDKKGFSSLFTKNEYMEAVRKIREYIICGDVYQVNMSQRFEMDFKGDAFSLFKMLYKKNPAPFFAYINAENHKIISTSPERFLLRKKNRIETRPIKGTRPRGKTCEEDAFFKKNLQKSEKDSAELSMIVDLLRNDFGKICKAGTVKVLNHKRIEAYDNVYHLVSDVEGELKENISAADIIRAVFPGGSITGCPKIRAMEIIDELEPVRRHIYTGSIGYISFHENMDLSIAIRTAVIFNDKIFFSAGGGIVFDSDPEEEYEETLHKGKTFFTLLENNKENIEKKIYIWFNGALKPEEDISISPLELGFSYGYGIFETIKAEKEEPLFLKEHIKRFDNAFKSLFEDEPPDIEWGAVIKQVLNKNELKESASVKITAYETKRENFPKKYSFLVSASPYANRFTDKEGASLLTYEEPRETPLADFKTLNYLFYYLAGKWAKKNGADEALILNSDKSVSETNTANLIVIKDKKAIKPLSNHVLDGIMQNVICDILIKKGYKIYTQKLYIKDLLEADLLFITNSLIGAVPVIKINNYELKIRRNILIDLS